MRQVVILDTETTGFEPQTNSIVEIAGVRLGGMWFSGLVRPTTKISFGAMATHHITEEMVESAQSLEDALNFYLPHTPEGYVFVAHNAQFDRSFMPEWYQQQDWICTWRVASHLWPDAESHSNQSLRYELGLDVRDMPEQAGGNAHRALYDAWVTSKLFERCLETSGFSVAELVELTKKPLLLTKVRFGKHRDELWSDVPKSYLRWVLSQDFDDDVKNTAEFHLR